MSEKFKLVNQNWFISQNKPFFDWFVNENFSIISMYRLMK